MESDWWRWVVSLLPGQASVPTSFRSRGRATLPDSPFQPAGCGKMHPAGGGCALADFRRYYLSHGLGMLDALEAACAIGAESASTPNRFGLFPNSGSSHSIYHSAGRFASTLFPGCGF